MSIYEQNLRSFIKSTMKSKNQQHLKNINTFDINYCPKEIFYRNEIKEMIKTIIQFNKFGVNNNRFYYGSRGCGKTITLKYLSKIMKDYKLTTPIFYVNCRNEGTAFRVLSYLTKEKSQGLGLPDLMKKINNIHKKIILILDEIDLIATRERSKDLLYILSRSENTKFQLFLLSNNVNFYGKLDEATKSTLQLKKEHFRNYEVEELKKILTMRCDEGKIKIPKSFISELSARTVKESNSDVRVALKSMELAAINKKFNNLEQVFNQAKSDIFHDLIQYQQDQILFILKATIITKNKIVKEVYKTYQSIAKRNMARSLSYVSFLNNLSYLQSMGVILLMNEKVNRGWSNRIELLCKPELINKIYKEKDLDG